MNKKRYRDLTPIEKHYERGGIIGKCLIGAFIVMGVFYFLNVDNWNNKLREKNKKEFETSRLLEGKVIRERYYPEKEGNAWSGNIEDKYLITIELPDGSKKVFEYTGENARKMDCLYVVGDSIKWRGGYKPHMHANWFEFTNKSDEYIFPARKRD